MLPGDHIVRITSVRQLGGTVGASQITVAFEVVTSTRSDTPPGSTGVHSIKLGRPTSFTDVLGFLSAAVAASGLRKRHVGSGPGQLPVGMALAWVISPAQPLTATLLQATAVERVAGGGSCVTVAWAAPAQATDPGGDRMQGTTPADRAGNPRSAERVVAGAHAKAASRVELSAAPVLASTTKPADEPELTTPPLSNAESPSATPTRASESAGASDASMPAALADGSSAPRPPSKRMRKRNRKRARDGKGLPPRPPPPPRELKPIRLTSDQQAGVDIAVARLGVTDCLQLRKIARAMIDLGPAQVERLIDEAIAIHAGPGMLGRDRSSPRPLGGIFFFLLYVRRMGKQ